MEDFLQGKKLSFARKRTHRPSNKLRATRNAGVSLTPTPPSALAVGTVSGPSKSPPLHPAAGVGVQRPLKHNGGWENPRVPPVNARGAPRDEPPLRRASHSSARQSW